MEQEELPECKRIIQSANHYESKVNELNEVLYNFLDIANISPEIGIKLKFYISTLFQFQELYRKTLRSYYDFNVNYDDLITSVLLKNNRYRSLILSDIICQNLIIGDDLLELSKSLQQTFKELNNTVVDVVCNYNQELHQIEVEVKASCNGFHQNNEEIEKLGEELQKEQQQLLMRGVEESLILSNIFRLTSEVDELEKRVNNELVILSDLEGKKIELNKKRMEMTKLVGIFPLLLDVSLNISDAVNHLITTQTTAKSIISSNPFQSWDITLGIMVVVSKLALRGQYLTDKSFSIVHQSSWKTLMNIMNERKCVVSSIKYEDLF